MPLRILLFAALFALTPAAALADYKSEYKAYVAASEAGDDAKALEHGERAWREAEVALGDHAKTAILAYNYARYAAALAPEKAFEPLARAIAITRAGVGALSLDDLLLREAELHLRIAMKDVAKRTALGDLLAESAPQDETTRGARAIGWRTLAAALIAEEKFDDATEAADRAVETATRLQPDEAGLREALLLAGVARITRPIRKENHVAEAVALLDRALALYPPQRDLDHFDPMLAKTISWRQSVAALVRSIGSPVIRGGSRLPTGEDLKSAYERAAGRVDTRDWVKWQVAKPASCPQFEDMWRDLKYPRYPARARRKGNIGAIVIGYDLSETGVENERILADFSEAGFGEAALKAMRDWRLKAPVEPACRPNNFVIVSFSIR